MIPFEQAYEAGRQKKTNTSYLETIYMLERKPLPPRPKNAKLVEETELDDEYAKELGIEASENSDTKETSLGKKFSKIIFGK